MRCQLLQKHKNLGLRFLLNWKRPSPTIAGDADFISNKSCQPKEALNCLQGMNGKEACGNLAV